MPDAPGEGPIPYEAAGAGARGFNKALTDFVGMPGNLMDMAAVPAAKALGLVDKDRQHIFGGADTTARRGLDALAHAAGMSPDAHMAYEDRQELPRNYRWAGAAGEQVGGAVPMAAGLGLAAKGANLAVPLNGSTGLVEGLVQNAARNPGKWAAGEMAATHGAAQGATIGQSFNPDSNTAGDLGGLAGAIVNPLGAIGSLGGVAKQVGASVGTALGSKKAAEEYAASYLSKLLTAGGEASPEQIEAITKAIDAGKANELLSFLSAADRSLSPTLLGLQSRMAADSPDFAKALEAQRDAASAGLREAANTELGGDVSALTRQAEAVRDRADSQRRTFVGNAQSQNAAEREALMADAAAVRG